MCSASGMQASGIYARKRFNFPTYFSFDSASGIRGARGGWSLQKCKISLHLIFRVVYDKTLNSNGLESLAWRMS